MLLLFLVMFLISDVNIELNKQCLVVGYQGAGKLVIHMTSHVILQEAESHKSCKFTFRKLDKQ